MSTLARAIEIAVQAHKGQTRENGLPYVLHPIRVMLHMETEPQMIVAILHDVVEDTETTLEELREEGFASEVIEALALLTHDKAVPYEDYIENIVSNPIARRVKLADLQDNMTLTEIPLMTEGKLRRLEKYHKAWIRLTGGDEDAFSVREATP